MAGPITWQNVNGASLADAFQPMAGAARSMNGAFDVLQNTLKQHQVTQDANWEQGKQNNTAAYMAKLALLGKTPESLQEAMATGELEAMQQGFGAQIDQKQTFGAAERILEGSRKQVREAGEFDTYQRKEMQKPISSDLRATIASGNTELADALLKENGGLDDIAELQTLNSARKAANIQAKYADNEEGRRKRDQELQELKAADDIRTNAAQRAAAAAQQAGAAEERRFRREDRALDREAKLALANPLGKRYEERVKNSTYSQGDYSTPEGKTALMVAMKARGVSQGQQEDVLYNLAKYYGKGAAVAHDKEGKPSGRLPLSVGTILDALDEATDNPIAIGFSRRGDDLVNNLDKKFGVNSDGTVNKKGVTLRDDSTIGEMLEINALREQRLAPLREAAKKATR